MAPSREEDVERLAQQQVEMPVGAAVPTETQVTNPTTMESDAV